MNILIGLSVFQTGGAEIFALRLASELKKIGHKVFIYDVLKEERNDKFCSSIEEFGIQILEVAISNKVNWMLWKLNRLFSIFGYNDFYTIASNKVLLKKLKKICEVNNIQLINSHTFLSDLFLIDLKIPMVITMHGDYEDGDKKITNDIQKKIFHEKCLKIFSSVNHIIYVADKNLELLYSLNIPVKKTKVYVGLNKQDVFDVKRKVDSNFNFLMLARGIEDKGWLVAIYAFIELKKRVKNVKLELVYTETNYMKSLKEKFSNIDGIIFNGYTSNPIAHVVSCDAVILPSYSECCPTCLIEAMAYNKPSIATNTGDVKSMIEIEGVSQCGYCIEIDINREKMEFQLAEKMELIITDAITYNKFKENTIRAFEKFDFKNIVKEYVYVFEKSIK